jgi:hypothetical protein
MSTATDERLVEVRRRIDRLEVEAHRATEGSRARMQRYIDTVRRDEESARATVRDRAAAVDDRLEQLDNELGLAEHRVAAEFAATEDAFRYELERQLRRWDAYLDRMQVKAAAKSGAARKRAEAAIADLRQRRVSIHNSLSAIGTAAGDDWGDAKARLLAELDELKSRADAAWRS